MNSSTGHRPGAGELEFRLSVQTDGRQPAVSVRRQIEAIVHAEAAACPGDEWHSPPGSLGLLIAVDFAPDRLAETRETLAAAITALPDGVRLALVEERVEEDGRPRRAEWKVADDLQRRQVQAAAEWLRIIPPKGGTSYSDWLAQARAMFAAEDAPRIRHLLVITDGTSGRTPRLQAELRACVGEFTCDVLGVGERWQPDVLSEIAQQLHGEATCVRGGEQVTAWLTGRVDQLLCTRVPLAPLEITLRPEVRLDEVHQLRPLRTPLEQLTVRGGNLPGERGGPAQPQRHAFATRLWADSESRTYELLLSADPSGDPLNEEIQLATVTLGAASLPVLVRWSDESSSAGGGVAASHGKRTELVNAYLAGCEALISEAWSVAEEQLGTAARLAYELRDADYLERVRRVADVEDPPTGRVRLRRGVDRHTVKESELYSRQVPSATPAEERGRDGKGGDGEGRDDGKADRAAAGQSPPLVDCPDAHCSRRSVQGAGYCVACGAAL